MKIQIHPAAESYRLMREDELAALADDIAARGQIDPIVMGRVNGASTAVLVDGRNRLEACWRAKIEPRFETLEFADDEAVRAFVKSRSERRDLSKGEKAMGLAFLYPEPEKGGRGNKRKVGETPGFSERRLYDARAVLRHSLPLAEAVRDGTLKLDEALERIRNEKRELESAETRLADLRAGAADLADLVDEERISLDEAAAAFEQRKAEAAKIEQSKRDTLIRVASTAFSNILALGVPDFLDDIRVRVSDQEFRTEILKFMRIDAPQYSTIDDGAAALKKLIELLREAAP